MNGFLGFLFDIVGGFVVLLGMAIDIVSGGKTSVAMHACKLCAMPPIN